MDSSAFDDLQYSRVLNDVGTLAMSLPVGNPYAQELIALGLDAVLDDFVEVSRTSPITGKLIVEDTFLLRLIHRFRENDTERLAIGGYSLNHLLLRRIVDPDDDPLQAGGYSTKAGLASSVMREYVIQQMGYAASAVRQFPLFNVPVIGDFGTSVGRRLRHEVMLEVLQGIALANQCDFVVQRGDGRNLNCNIQPIGTDRRYSTNFPSSPYLIIDPIRGNLANPSMLFDRKDEKTFMYALGQGQGAARKLLKLPGEGLYDSPFNRIEVVADVRSSDKADALTLYTEGNAKLREYRKKREFTFDASQLPPGNEYRNDWDIGDYLTQQWEGVMLDLRLNKVEVTVSSSGETLTPGIITI